MTSLDPASRRAATRCGALFQFGEHRDLSDSEIFGRIQQSLYDAGISSIDERTARSFEHSLPLLRRAMDSAMRQTSGAANWWMILEFQIPRIGKRADAIVIADGLIFVIEFKVGEGRFELAAMRQVEDYALDLNAFHKLSHDRPIVPILVATESQDSRVPSNPMDCVKAVHCCGAASLGEMLTALHARLSGTLSPLSGDEWAQSPYFPTPTIIEAAQRLYAEHTVEELARSEADAHNLTATTDAVIEAVSLARQERRKIICFITGVPGAGKTLAGLKVVHRLRAESLDDRAVFMTGNGPLVTVLSEALARDRTDREDVSLSVARRQTKATIQNVHRFISEILKGDDAPETHVALFDEAQRAWNRKQTATKWGRDESEPVSMLRIMDRHDWAVIVALVGSGQEINTGEAGLAEWGRALLESFPHWQAWVSPQLAQGEQAAVGQNLFPDSAPDRHVRMVPALHLEVSIRSFRSTHVSSWVDAVLRFDHSEARRIMASITTYPVVLTRSLATAHEWLRTRRRGNRRSGLVATSGARRLRPLGITVDTRVDEAIWFLAPPEDVRSSSYLELAATEFAIQGLELDWVGLCWDGDLRPTSEGWAFYDFKGSRWTLARNAIRCQYILNKYRVLLTRAREGLVIWVPEGDSCDTTRPPKMYDAIARALIEFGVRPLE